jgi:hypothetical protein
MKNKAQWLTALLTIGAVLEIPTGLGFIFNPQGAVVLLAATVNPAGELVARLAGGGLLGLGLACWFARKTPLAPGSLGASFGLLAYNLTGCATLAMAASGLSHGAPMTVFGTFMHGALAAAQLRALLARDEVAAVA